MTTEAHEAAWDCWYRTRILGGSASMWCDAPVDWDTSIVHLMDKAYEEGKKYKGDKEDDVKGTEAKR